MLQFYVVLGPERRGRLREVDSKLHAKCPYLRLKYRRTRARASSAVCHFSSVSGICHLSLHSSFRHASFSLYCRHASYLVLLSSSIADAIKVLFAMRVNGHVDGHEIQAQAPNVAPTLASPPPTLPPIWGPLAKYNGRCTREFYRYYHPFRTLSDHQPALLDLHDPAAVAAHVPVASPDQALTAFCQLVAVKLRVRRAVLFFFDENNGYVLAEASQSLSLQIGRFVTRPR